MKSLLTILAVAVAIAGSTSTAAAQGPPPGYGGPGPMMNPQMMGGYDPAAAAAYRAEVVTTRDRYGLNPAIRDFFGSKGCGACGTCYRPNNFSRHNNYMPPQMNPANGGTLAFPHQPFTRSPRDFFEQ